MKEFQKLEPVRVFEQVVQQIRELIVSGELQVGDKLPPEQELERQLSVSRSSIREALRVLEAEGLVEVRRGSGTYITSSTGRNRSRDEVANWLEQREEFLVQELEVREFTGRIERRAGFREGLGTKTVEDQSPGKNHGENHNREKARGRRGCRPDGRAGQPISRCNQ